MEYTILYSYWEEFYKKRKSIKEVWKALDKREVVCFIFIIVFGLASIVTNTMGASKNLLSDKAGIFLPIGFMLLELLSVIFLYNFIDKKDIKNTKTTIQNIKNKYKKEQQWFKEMGFEGKIQIKQFGFRCENVLQQMEKEKTRIQNLIEKVFTIFYVPAVFAIISWILSSNKNLHNMGKYMLFVILLVTLVAAIYLLVISISKGFETSDFSDIRKMKCLIRDINGILDYCYECNDEENVLIQNKIGQFIEFEKNEVPKHRRK